MNPTHQDIRFADRLDSVPRSFVREILKVASNPAVLSFAGGLPNPELFPVNELKDCMLNVFESFGTNALQYAETEGLYALREWISFRYKQRYNLDVTPERILITSGSQQALDLIGKLFINAGDKILIERPAYLGALQCFAMYQPSFLEVSLESDGIDLAELEELLSKADIRLFYGIPNFQNPTGVSYSVEKRIAVAERLATSGTLFVEDDPYGEITFNNQVPAPIYSYLPDQTILLGSFSKIVAPGLRIGWMVATPEIIRKATMLKQASDLHSGNLSQYLLNDFLRRYKLDDHIRRITANYKEQRDIMLSSLNQYFPSSITLTRPEGGMFCWLRLPPEITARQLLDRAIKENILFVPGDTFYKSNPDLQTLRLNFSNVDKQKMEQGLQKLGNMI